MYSFVLLLLLYCSDKDDGTFSLSDCDGDTATPDTGDCGDALDGGPGVGVGGGDDSEDDTAEPPTTGSGAPDGATGGVDGGPGDQGSGGNGAASGGGDGSEADPYVWVDGDGDMTCHDAWSETTDGHFPDHAYQSGAAPDTECVCSLDVDGGGASYTLDQACVYGDLDAGVPTYVTVEWDGQDWGGHLTSDDGTVWYSCWDNVTPHVPGDVSGSYSVFVSTLEQDGGHGSCSDLASVAALQLQVGDEGTASAEPGPSSITSLPLEGDEAPWACTPTTAHRTRFKVVPWPGAGHEVLVWIGEPDGPEGQAAQEPRFAGALVTRVTPHWSDSGAQRLQLGGRLSDPLAADLAFEEPQPLSSLVVRSDGPLELSLDLTCPETPPELTPSQGAYLLAERDLSVFGVPGLLGAQDPAQTPHEQGGPFLLTLSEPQPDTGAPQLTVKAVGQDWLLVLPLALASVGEFALSFERDGWGFRATLAAADTLTVSVEEAWVTVDGVRAAVPVEPFGRLELPRAVQGESP